MAAPAPAQPVKTWAEVEKEASINTLAEMVKQGTGLMYPHPRTLFENYMWTYYKRPPRTNVETWIQKAAISADLFIYRTGYRPHEFHAIGNRHRLTFLTKWVSRGFDSSAWGYPYIMDRLTDTECALAECIIREYMPEWVGFLRVLSIYTRNTFAASSLGQLHLPADLVQRIGQFCSDAITPWRPVALRPPSYLARVQAIRAEMQADPVAGEARAASQMAQLETDTRGDKRART